MLHELVKYDLESEPGFSTKTIRWLLVFSKDGSFLGVQPTDENPKSAGRLFEACPDLTDVELKTVFDGHRRRHFLVDDLEAVARFSKSGDVDEKLSTKNRLFVDLLETGAAAMPVLGTVAATLRDPGALARIDESLTEKKAKPTDKATIAVTDDGSDTPILVERDDWRGWWRGFRKDLVQRLREKSKPKRSKGSRADTSAPKYLCLLSGEPVEPVGHFLVKGLADVGGQPSGDRLVSFDKEAFSSFGLPSHANAAMGETMAKKYVTVLNDLLRHRSHRLAGAKVVYWYSGRVEENDDVLDELFAGFEQARPDETAPKPSAAKQTRERAQAESRAKRLLDAIRNGERPELKGYRYHALTLSANSGRVVIRDWMEGSFTELLEAVTAWFDDLQIPRLNSLQIGKPPRFEHVLTSALRPRPSSQSYKDWSKSVSSHRTALWQAALGGPKRPIPRALIEQIAEVHVASILARHAILPKRSTVRETGDREEKKYPLSLLFTRMGIMRAYCNRYARISGQGDYHVETILDPNHPRSAYHVGRLMAVLEMIQRRAQGELGATIAQTHYASAATRPIAALPRLESLVQHHIPKIEPFHLREQYQNTLTEIHLAIGRTIPRSFNLEDQCLFHLGYYHQRAYQPFSESPYRHWTTNGDHVRSKSEVVIANLLASLGIDYQYEAPLRYSGDQIVTEDENGPRNIREIKPDFTIRNAKFGKPVYIEHLGMMDNFAYRGDWEWKSSLYRDLGILPIEEGIGQNGVLVTTREEKGTIDCRQLTVTLSQLV